MRIGYARTSTLDQVAGFEAQERALAAAGACRIYREQVSYVAARPELENMLANIRPEDTLVMTKLDRLARSVRHLGEIVEHLDKVGAGLHTLDMNIDSTTASGRLMLNVFGAVAQFEREMMLERQPEGIDKAERVGIDRATVFRRERPLKPTTAMPPNSSRSKPPRTPYHQHL